MSARVVAVLLAMALGAALWALWDARGQVDDAEATLARLEAQGQAYADSAAWYRAKVDTLEAEVTTWAEKWQTARRRFDVHATPVGPVVVLDGDTVPQPIPTAVAAALRACDSIVPACQAGLMKAQAALTLEARRAEVAESALVVWEHRPAKKPRFGFQAGLAVGLALALGVVLVAQ